MTWKAMSNSDRLMQCVGCGALATDVAARALNWLQDTAAPTAALCHQCQTASGEGPRPRDLWLAGRVASDR
jgi:hypothetical protein